MIAGAKPYTFNTKGNKNLPSEEGAGAEVQWGFGAELPACGHRERGAAVFSSSSACAVRFVFLLWAEREDYL